MQAFDGGLITVVDVYHRGLDVVVAEDFHDYEWVAGLLGEHRGTGVAGDVECQVEAYLGKCGQRLEAQVDFGLGDVRKDGFDVGVGLQISLHYPLTASAEEDAQRQNDARAHHLFSHLVDDEAVVVNHFAFQERRVVADAQAAVAREQKPVEHLAQARVDAREHVTVQIFEPCELIGRQHVTCFGVPLGHFEAVVGILGQQFFNHGARHERFDCRMEFGHGGQLVALLKSHVEPVQKFEVQRIEW